MIFESFIARRYFSSHRKNLFVSFILFITLLAVATGTFALIFVLSVMNGFEKDFRTRVIGFKAPIVMMGENLLTWVPKIQSADPRITEVLPFIEGEAVVQSESGGALGVKVRGMVGPPDPRRLGDYFENEPFAEKSILLGEELSDSLKAHPAYRQELRLIFPIGDVSPAGDLVPRIRKFDFTGVFRTGFYEYDSKSVVVNYEEARKLFGPEARSGLEVWVEPFEAAEVVKKVLQKELGLLARVESWRDQNPKLFAAMKLEKIGMFLLLSVLLLVASFNIFGLTSLAAQEKVKDMAILRSIGLPAHRVKRIFILKALSIGGGGGLLGGSLALAVTTLLQRYPLPLPSTYYLDHLPIQVDVFETLLTMILVPAVTLLASFYPALQASKRQPIETLRYE